MCEFVRVECDDDMAWRRFLHCWVWGKPRPRFWFFIQMMHLNKFTTIISHVRHGVSNHRSLDCLFNRLFWIISTNILTDRLWKDRYSSHKESVKCEKSPYHNVVISSTVCVRTSSFVVSIWYSSIDAKTKWPTFSMRYFSCLLQKRGSLIQISPQFVFKRNKIGRNGSCIMIFGAQSFSELIMNQLTDACARHQAKIISVVFVNRHRVTGLQHNNVVRYKTINTTLISDIRRAWFITCVSQS